MKGVIPFNGGIRVVEKPVPEILHPRDAIVKVKRSAICTSDLHIINDAVPRYVPDTILGHEFVGEVVSLGSDINNLKIGDRVAANCITFCGECWFCRHGFINNCVNGGWELGCRIDGAQAEFVRVPFADCGLNKIPDNISYDSALFVGDILSSGYWGAEIANISKGDNVAVIGAGPVGLCAMMSAKLLGAKKVTVFETDNKRASYALELGLADEIGVDTKTACYDAVIEAAGGENTFETAWRIARPNAVVSVVAMYEKPQTLPLNEMYGKNLIFKTGGVDAVNCDYLLKLISEGKISTDFLITDSYKFEDIEAAYKRFKEKDCYKLALIF